jgi:hypothetical protein
MSIRKGPGRRVPALQVRPSGLLLGLLAHYVLARRPRQSPSLVIRTGHVGGVCTPAALDLVGNLVVASVYGVVAPAGGARGEILVLDG